MPVYEIVFLGELVEGAQPERVKANLGKLFQADAARLELLFSGRRLVLKNNLDAETAEKYRATLERAGARVQVVSMASSPMQQPSMQQPSRERPAPMDDEIEEVELAPPPDEPTWTRKISSSSGRLQVQARDVYMAAFSDVDAPDFSLAQVGSDMQDPKPQPVAPSLDLSGISLAPVGSDMGEIEKPKAGPAPDTSHLKVL